MSLPTPYYDRDGIVIYVGDNRDVLPHIEPVHAVVTDPPYGLEFMGKGWDHSVPGVEFWQEISAAMLPGAHLLAFGGTRTYHRMAVAIEDAGYEIRDTLQWLYGSGMPKGWNFSNRIPDDQWCRCARGNAVSCDHEGSDHGQPQTEHNLRSMRHADVPASVNTGAERREVLHTGVPESSLPAYREANSTGFYEGREQPGMEGRAIHRAGEGVCDDTPTGSPTSTAQRVRAGAHSGSGTDARQTTGTGRGSASHQPATGRQSTGELAGLPEPPRSLDDRALRDGGACPRCGKLSQDFRGFDVALKPAYEPIIMARLPFKGTVAAQVLATGTGAINVDACRIEGAPPSVPQPSFNSPTGQVYGFKTGEGRSGEMSHAAGRWPANVILDEAAAQDLGEPARYFYCAKSSRRERNAGLSGTLTVKHMFSGKDRSLCEATVAELQRVTSGIPTVKWLTGESGESIMGQCQQGSLSTISTAIKQIIASRTYSLSMPSHISESTAVARCEAVSGGSHAESAESSSPLNLDTTSAGMASDQSVKSALFDVLLRASNVDEWHPATNIHSTVKPLALMRYLIQMVTPPGGVILDPFAGSGSTLVAAAELGFHAIGIELSEEYAEIAARRVDHALNERARRLPGLEATP